MKANFRLSEVPSAVLGKLSEKTIGALLLHLEVETVFDVASIKALLFIGHQAIHEEMERRGMLVEESNEESPEVWNDVQG